jgi:hypothetical protein
VHLGTLGTRGGERVAAQPYVLGLSRGLERWSCNLDIRDGVALAALRPEIPLHYRRVQSKYSVLLFTGVRDPESGV